MHLRWEYGEGDGSQNSWGQRFRYLHSVPLHRETEEVQKHKEVSNFIDFVKTLVTEGERWEGFKEETGLDDIKFIYAKYKDILESLSDSELCAELEEALRILAQIIEEW